MTVDDLEWLRSYLGPTPDDDELDEMVTRLGRSETAVRIIRTRIAILASGGPLSFSIPGEYSENRGENIAALKAFLSEIPGGSSTISTSPMTFTPSTARRRGYPEGR